MSRIVLVDPPTTLEETPKNSERAMPWLGLLNLASVMRHMGVDTRIIQASSLGLEDTISQINKSNPRYLGLTATTSTIFAAGEVARRVKEVSPRTIVIIGGPHLTAIPEETMEVFTPFDIGVIGEGEDTFKELITYLEGGMDLLEVKGIIFRRGDNLVKTQSRPFINDIDSIPFPSWDLVEDFPHGYNPAPGRFLRLPIAPMVSSRGCPYQCIFCDRSVFGNKCRAHSAGYVLELIKYLKNKFCIREIIFEDDTFVTFKKRLVEVCEGLIKHDLRLSWSCLGRADAVDLETLRLMKRAGCWRISYGIETGDQRVMDFIGKRLTLDKVEKVLALTKRAGILTKGFFILGHPIDNDETIKGSIEFSIRVKLDDINVNMMTPFPGSRLYEIAHQYGEFDRDWKKMDLLNIVFVPKTLTKERLMSYSKEMMRRFYLRPSKIKTYVLRMLRNPTTFLYYINGFLSFIKGLARGTRRN